MVIEKKEMEPNDHESGTNRVSGRDTRNIHLSRRKSCCSGKRREGCEKEKSEAKTQYEGRNLSTQPIDT